MPRNYTANFKGEEVAIKMTGYKILHVTVMLCITASGNKLTPHIILNIETVPKEYFCKDVTVWPQRNARMPSELMEHGLGCD
jgi:hypothetical protein